MVNNHLSFDLTPQFEICAKTQPDHGLGSFESNKPWKDWFTATLLFMGSDSLIYTILMTCL